MKFICKSLKDNDQWDEADCLVFSISPKYSRELLVTRAKCVTFLASCEQSYTAKVYLTWGSEMIAFDYDLFNEDDPTHAAPFGSYAQAEAEGTCENIPEEFDPFAPDPDSYSIARLRGQQIIFYGDGTMRLTAYEKHTGYTLESAEFNEEFLNQIIHEKAKK